jgi:hypothetical protein
MVAAGCAEQEDPDLKPSGGSGTTTAGSSNGGSSNGGSSSGGSSSGGNSAGTSHAGTSSGTSQGGSGGGGGDGDGSSGGGASMAGAGAGGSSAGAGGAGGTAGAGGSSAGAGGAGGTAGAGGKGGSGGTTPVDPCSNGKKDGSETDQDCGGSCTTKCGTGKGCEDLTDCVASNVCEADKCRANGCNASNCAYTLTRFIVGTTALKGQVFVNWDNDSLDVRFEMLDATPFDDQADSALNWQDDSVEIYLDLNNAKTTTYQADDFQIMVPRLAGNNVVGIGTGLNTSAVMVTRTSSASSYTLIVGIPWSALNNAAYPSGKTIGFDVGVNDDSDGGDRNSQIMLYGGSNNWNNTSQFGVLAITP